MRLRSALLAAVAAVALALAPGVALGADGGALSGLTPDPLDAAAPAQVNLTPNNAKSQPSATNPRWALSWTPSGGAAQALTINGVTSSGGNNPTYTVSFTAPTVSGSGGPVNGTLALSWTDVKNATLTASMSAPVNPLAVNNLPEAPYAVLLPLLVLVALPLARRHLARRRA